MKEEIEVHGGLCKLTFISGVTTGPEGSDSRNGIGFDVTHRYTVKAGEMAGTGVIGREDARRLAKMINDYLEQTKQLDIPTNRA